MIKNTLQKQINEAMKNKDEIKIMTLRMLSSAITNAEIKKNRESLTEEEEMAVIEKEAKKRKDAIEAYKKAGALERAEKEEKELAILSEFLPEEMSDGDIKEIVEKTVDEMNASSMADMGKVMGVVMGKIKGGADGNRVSALVKEKLS